MVAAKQKYNKIEQCGNCNNYLQELKRMYFYCMTSGSLAINVFAKKRPPEIVHRGMIVLLVTLGSKGIKGHYPSRSRKPTKSTRL